MQVTTVLSLLAAAAAVLTAHTASASGRRSLRHNSAMRPDPEWNPSTILDSDLEEAVKSCVRAYEAAWNDTFHVDDVSAAQGELFSAIYAKCVAPVADSVYPK